MIRRLLAIALLLVVAQVVYAEVHSCHETDEAICAWCHLNDVVAIVADQGSLIASPCARVPTPAFVAPVPLAGPSPCFLGRAPPKR